MLITILVGFLCLIIGFKIASDYFSNYMYNRNFINKEESERLKTLKSFFKSFKNDEEDN